jgi:DNA polymerase III epsilon subunit-like protein/DNA transposition AAA+ family ATPase
MKTVILDLETNGLYPEVTKVWCGVAYEIENDKYVEFTPNNINDLPFYLNTVDSLSCHNGIGFDLKVLKKIFNYEFKGKTYIDTLLLCRILWPDLEPATYRNDKGQILKTKGSHSIEAWGVRLGVAKPEHEDWSQYSPEMLIRCRKDTEIQAMLYEKINREIQEVTTRNPSVSFDSATKMEHKVWKLMEEQSDYGFAFDLESAYGLVSELEAKIQSTREILVPQLPIKVTPHPTITKAFTANGSLTSITDKVLNKCTDDYLSILEVCGDFQKVTFKPFNIGSEKDLKEYLLENGWKPTEWNVKKDKHNKPIRDDRGRHIKTSPKLPKTAEDWDDVANRLGNPNISLIAEFNKASHRKSQIEGLISKTRMDHRIEAQAITCATNTARMVHRQVVNIPKNDPKVYYGKEMRSLFIASEGKILVGCDASALEAKCEAHYVHMYDPDAALRLIEGDIHTFNANVWNVTRNVAKSGKYALLYGCSAAKLATVLGKPVNKAKGLYEDYLEANPAVKMVKEMLEQQFNTYGYIIGIDGRPLSIRYKHALLNSLLQSCGSIAMKYALCILSYDLKSKNIAHNFVGNFHDEMIIEVAPEVSSITGELAVQSIEKAGRMLSMNVPLTGESKIGKDWSQTH